MGQLEKQELLNEVEHKIGMARTFYNNDGDAQELIDIYEGYRKEGATLMEIKLLLDDAELFLDSVKETK